MNCAQPIVETRSVCVWVTMASQLSVTRRDNGITEGAQKDEVNGIQGGSWVVSVQDEVKLVI